MEDQSTSVDIQRVSRNRTLSKGSADRVVQAAIVPDGEQGPGLEFGDVRVMALLAALVLLLHLANGLALGFRVTS